MATNSGKRSKAEQVRLEALTGEAIRQSAFVGESFASELDNSSSVTRFIQASVDSPRRTIARGKKSQGLFENIYNSASPFHYDTSTNLIDINEVVTLCQKAYVSVSIFRNTVDMLTEFSNTQVYFEGGNKKARDFFKYWWEKKIGGWDLSGQFFREWYRSGNWFAYRFDGEVSIEGLKEINKVYGANEDVDYTKLYKLPVKYLALNPADIKSEGILNFFESIYYKSLNSYEIKSIISPKTEQAQDFADSLDPKILAQIKKGELVNIPIDPNKTYSVFCNKQDYEPFAVPGFFPVLPDIDLKMGYKKIEKIITRTVEYVILQIKVGTPEIPNPEGIGAIEELFRNEAIGRVLVTDGTTDMEFLIPDINKVLGPEKYEQVNQDIADGLQNIFFGDQNFSSTSIKISVFMERLKNAQNAFLTYFLNPEIKRIAKELGFKNYPEAKMTQINLQDKVNMARVFTRLMELSVLTPEDGLEAIKTGIIPERDVLVENQREYANQKREEELWVPLLNNTPPQMVDEEGNPVEKTDFKKPATGQPGQGRTPGTGKKLSAPRKTSPTGQSKADDQEAYFDMSKVSELCILSAKIEAAAMKEVKSAHNIKRLTKDHEQTIKGICALIYANESPETWEDKVAEYVKAPKPVEESIADEIDEIVEKYQTSNLLASILRHSVI